MLVLQRKTDEEILIGKDIRIAVLEIRPESVRLGIEAPGDVPIVRPDAKCKERKGQ
jgi:carbon storage regulator